MKIKSKELILNSFIEMIRSNLDFHNLTCEDGFELSYQDVINHLSSKYKTSI